jgi:hypothetical protein
MSIVTIEQLKSKFEGGDYPRSTDYINLIDTLAALPAGNVILNGSTAPASETGSNGDFYIDTTNYDIYGPKTSGEWGSPTSLVGPTGATGSTGATGAAGTNGTNGTNGATGATGDTGPAGPGVASGGTTGQYLTKVDGTNYNTQWSTLDLSGKAPLNAPTFTGTVTSSNNLVVDGDFTVNGTNFSASATSITIEDNLVQLAHQNAVNTVDLGLVVGYNDGAAKHSGIVRDVSDDKWKLFKGVTTEPTTTVDFSQGSLDTLAVAGIEATTATIGDVSNTELQYLNGVTSAIQTQLDSKVDESIITAKGDLYVGSASATLDNLTVGTNGYLLTADSNETLGVKWAEAPVSLPSQSGNSGKYLTTDGTTSSWATVSASGGGDPTPTVFLLMGA